MPGQEAGYEFVEHTADLGVRAWGATLEAAFAEAARGMMAYILDRPEAVEAREEHPLRIEEQNLDRLLFAFLDELNFKVLTDGLVWRRVRVTRLDPDRCVLEAVAEGEAHDEERHGHIHEIKAMTYHDIRVTRDPPEVYLIFDI